MDALKLITDAEVVACKQREKTGYDVIIQVGREYLTAYSTNELQVGKQELRLTVRVQSYNDKKTGKATAMNRLSLSVSTLEK